MEEKELRKTKRAISIEEENKNFLYEKIELLLNCGQCERYWTLILNLPEYKDIDLEDLTCPFGCKTE